TKNMRAQRAVHVGTDRFDGDIHARQADIVLRKFRHGGKIDVFDVGKRNFGVVAIVSLELVGIVIAGKIEIVEPWDEAIINDIKYVWVFQVVRHSANNRTVLSQGWSTEAFAIALHHFRQIEIDFIAGPILDQRQSIAVLDFAAHRWNSNRYLRTAAKLRSPFGSMRNLYPPKFQAKGAHPHQHEERDKLNPQTRIEAAPIHSKSLLSRRVE